MNKTVKKVVAFMLVLMISLCSIEICPVKASESENTDAEFKVTGASIRFINDKTEVDGIRFGVAIREDIFQTLSSDQKANYRLLVMPTALVDGKLEKDETYTFKSGQNTVTTKPVDVEIDWSSVKTQNGYQVTHVYLYNINKSYYTTGLTARMYYQDGEDAPIYSDMVERSYTGVASAALNDVSASKDTDYTNEAGDNYSPYDETQRNALLGVKYEKIGTWDYDGETLTTDGTEVTSQNTNIYPTILEREEKITSSNFVIETSFYVGVSDESVYVNQPDGTDSNIKGFIFGYDNETKSYMILDFRYRSDVANSNGVKVATPGWYPYLRVDGGENAGWSSTVVGKQTPLETGKYDFRISVDGDGAAAQVIVECKQAEDNQYKTIINTNGNYSWSTARLQFVGTKVGFKSETAGQTLEFDSDIKVYNDTVQTRGMHSERVVGTLNTDGTGTISGVFVTDYRTDSELEQLEGIAFSGQCGSEGYLFYALGNKNVGIKKYGQDEQAWKSGVLTTLAEGTENINQMVSFEDNDEIFADYQITISNSGTAKVFEIDYRLVSQGVVIYERTGLKIQDEGDNLYTGTDVYLYSEDMGSESDAEAGDGKTIFYPVTVTMAIGIEQSDEDTSIEDIDIDLTETERYTNPITDENQPYRAGSVEAQLLSGATETIEDISMSGDPYILRYNGKYYLYVSTDNWWCSYRCWESLDLLHYTYLGEYDLLDKNGNRTENDDKTNQGYDLECPWAPEVHYWNGEFYMYTSPHASGNIVLKSTTGLPYGDYQVVYNTNAISIDGSIFIDDNEDKWYVRPYTIAEGKAGYGAAVMKITDMATLAGGSWAGTSQAGITGGCVEGPFLFKRNGIYYLISTGEDVSYSGYRLNYAYNDSGLGNTYNVGSVGGAENWSTEIEPNLIINTEGDYYGYGHGAVTLGPNLDSCWFIYHMTRNSNVSRRTLGINRVEFSGTRMSVMGQDTETIAPEAPDFYTSYFTALSDTDWEGNKSGVIARSAGYRSYTDARTLAGEGLYQVGNQLLSGRLAADGETVELMTTGSRFTAEYNFKDITTDGSFQCLFGGGYVTIEGTTVKLYQGTTKLAEAPMLVNGESGWNWSAYHDIIVAYEEGRITVSIDGCTKIDVEATGLGNGAIGYAGASGTQIGGATFSNQAFGSSDKEAAKVTNGTFFATNYYEAKTGEKASVLSASSKSYVVSTTGDEAQYLSSWNGTHTYHIYKDATAFTLAQGDRVVYKIDVPENGTYSLSSLFSNSSDGSIIKIQIDGETPICYTLKKNDYRSIEYDKEYYEALEFQKRVLDTVYLEKGLHTLTIKAVSGDYTAIEYEMTRISTVSVKYQDDLSAVNQGDYFTDWYNRSGDGDDLVGNFVEWTIQEGAHYASADKKNLLRFANGNYMDYKVKVDIRTSAATTSDTNAGILLRLTNPSAGPRQTYGSGMGYYVCLGSDGVSIFRFDYNEREVAHYDTVLDADTYYTLEAECIDNTIVVRLNGEKVMTYIDPYAFVCGATALYSNIAESYYKNLEIIPICGRSTSDYITQEDTAYTIVSGLFRKVGEDVQVVSSNGILLDNTVNRAKNDIYAVNTAYTIVADQSESIKGIVLNYDEDDGSYLVMDYRYVEGSYRLYVRHYDGTAWTDNVWSCGVVLTENVQYEFNISAVNHTTGVTVSIEYKTGTDSFKQVSKTIPIVMNGRKAGYLSTAENNLQFVRLADTQSAEVGFGWPDDWSDAIQNGR